MRGAVGRKSGGVMMFWDLVVLAIMLFVTGGLMFVWHKTFVPWQFKSERNMRFGLLFYLFGFLAMGYLSYLNGEIFILIIASFVSFIMLMALITSFNKNWMKGLMER